MPVGQHSTDTSWQVTEQEVYAGDNAMNAAGALIGDIREETRNPDQQRSPAGPSICVPVTHGPPAPYVLIEGAPRQYHLTEEDFLVWQMRPSDSACGPLRDTPPPAPRRASLQTSGRFTPAMPVLSRQPLCGGPRDGWLAQQGSGCPAPSYL